jgi:hypothetical protein
VPAVIEGTLCSDYFQLRLSVEGYEFPHFNTGRDGNALACRILIEDTEQGAPTCATPQPSTTTSFRASPKRYEHSSATPPGRPSSVTPTRSPAMSSA